MIAPHIFILSLVLSVIWGRHMIDTINDWREVRTGQIRRRADGNLNRRKGEIAETFRSMLCAIALWSICVAYLLRTGCVLLGLGDSVGAQVAFFSIMGVNIPAALFVVASRKLP